MSFPALASVVKHSLFALAVIVGAGCSPTFNWREVRPADLSLAVMLPDKPSSLTQRVRLDAFELVMTMTGAQAGDLSFTVACATLPDEQAATRERVLAAMRAGMVRNIAGSESRAEPVSVPLVDTAGVQRPSVQGLRLSASGQARGRPMRLDAVFVGEGRRACQAVVLGETAPDNEVETFLGSLRLIAAGA